MNRKVTLFFVLAFACLCIMNVQLDGQSLTTGTPNLPPPAGTYISPQLYHQLYAAGIIIKDIKHQDFTSNQPPPIPGQTTFESFNSNVNASVSFDGGMTYSPMSAPANCFVRVTSTPSGDIGTTRAFDTEMLQLNIQGGSLPPGVMIRESPTLQSLGKTQITPDGAQYHIHSFFDIFTELSLDGGMSWQPANSAGHMSLQGDPEPPVVTPNPSLPLIPSHYVSPEEYHQLYNAGIVVKDVSHDRFTNNDPPPDTGAGGSTHTFNSNVRMQISTDGGMTWNTVNAPASTQVHMHKNTGSSGTPIGAYDTEMLQLNISGGGLPAGVMIRESPTLASTGKTSIKQANGGTDYEVSSFFDVFTELSTDGGMSWSPGQNGPTHMAVEPDPPPVVTNSPNIPPLPDHYVSPEAWHQAYNNGIVIRDVSHEKFLSNDPPPPADSTTTHTFGSGVTMDVSTDGGMTFNPGGASGNVQVQVKHKSHDPGTNTDYYQTEMLQLDLNGGPGIMIRESPSLPSKGKTSVRQLPAGQYAIGSFFDVFTELSTDGGMTWSPASGPAQMELQIDSGMICGVKWEDLNGDGVKDPGEPGLGGWKVQLTDQSTGTVYSAVTDGAGNYCCKVPPGTFRVEEVLQSGWMQTGGQPYYTVTVGPGNNIGGKDFGNFKTGSICGVKFNDKNGNGVKDPGEPGLPGWTICLQRNQPPPSGTFPTTGGTDFMGNTEAFIDINLSAAYGGAHIKLCASGNTNVQRATPSGNTAADSMLTEITLLDMVGTLPPPYPPTDTFHIRHKTDRRSFGQIQGNSFPAVSFFDVFYELQLPASLGGGTYVNYTATNMGTTINTIPPSGQSYLGVGSYIINKANVTDTLGIIKFVNHCLAGQNAGAHCDTCPKPPPNPTPPGSPLGTTCVITDANGNFCFTDLPPGSYNVTEIPQAGWTQTSANPPKIVIESNTATIANFGNQANGCQVCITKYYDANHNQKVPHDPTDTPMPGVQFSLVTSGGDTLSGLTDGAGKVCFPTVPPGPTTITEVLPAGYTYSVPKSGVMNFDLDCSGGNVDIEWQNAAAMVDSSFRSATSEQWATAFDAKNKRKMIKCKPYKVEFKLNLIVPNTVVGATPFSKLKIGFNMATQITGVWGDGKNKSIPLTCAVPGPQDPKLKIYTYTFVPPCVQPGDTIQFDGVGLKGSILKVAYVWSNDDTKPLTVKGSLSPVLKGGVPGDEVKEILRLPMPNLNNVGEELLAQGAFPVLVGGTASDSNVILLKKYNDAVKALGKDNKGTIMLHDSAAAADCFHHVAKLGKPKSGLSPDKINNKIFAEALALRLNILASQHQKFPVGFDSLIFDYHKVQPGPYDGQPVALILAKAEHYLATCQLDISKPFGGGTPADLYFTLRLINRSFAGPIDTVRWSCNKLELTGVRTLKDVPWLTANPGTTIPVISAPEGGMPLYQVPQSYTLYQNYPNPFNPTTMISFDLPEPAVVTLKVYNTLGQEVAVLINHETMEEGTEEVEFDASGLPSGVYFYRIVAKGIVDEDQGITGQTFLDVKKMLLVK